MTTSLEQIECLYRQAEKRNRDDLLACGRLCRYYVIQETDKGRSRYHAVAEIDERLRSGRESSHYTAVLMRTAAAVELLAGDTPDLGGLSWCALIQFAKLIHRPTRRLENWRLHPETELAARSLWAQAVRDGMSFYEAARQTSRLRWSGQKTVKRRLRRHGYDTSLPLKEIARKASVGDIAEMCLELVENAAYPERVLDKLLPLLEGLLPKRPSKKVAV